MAQMNGTVRIFITVLAASAATIAFLISGGIWLGNLQTRIDEHTGLLAHIDADRRLDRIEGKMSVMEVEVLDLNEDLHALSNEEEARHNEVMNKLRQMEWQPYLKED